VHIHVAMDDTELADLLDRILDKGLFLGSANLLTLGQTNLSDPETRISVSSLHTNTDSYARPLRPSRPPLRSPDQKS
jgi:hypothetical protein